MVSCLLSSVFEVLQILKSTTGVKLALSTTDVSQLVSLGLDLSLSRTEVIFCNTVIVYIVIRLALLLNRLFRQWMNEEKRWVSQTTGHRTILYKAWGKLCDTIPIHSMCFSLDLERPLGTCLTWIPLKSIYLHVHNVCGCYLAKWFFQCIWRTYARKKTERYLQKHCQLCLSQTNSSNTAPNVFADGTCCLLGVIA